MFLSQTLLKTAFQSVPPRKGTTTEKKGKRVDKSGNHWWKLFFPGCFLHFMKSAAAEKLQVFAEVQNLNYLLLNLNSACNSVFTFSIVTNCENIFEIFSPGGAASSL